MSLSRRGQGGRRGPKKRFLEKVRCSNEVETPIFGLDLGSAIRGHDRSAESNRVCRGGGHEKLRQAFGGRGGGE